MKEKTLPFGTIVTIKGNSPLTKGARFEVYGTYIAPRTGKRMYNCQRLDRNMGTQWSIYALDELTVIKKALPTKKGGIKKIISKAKSKPQRKKAQRRRA